MTTREDVRAYLDRLDLPVESVAEDMWLVRTNEGAELVVHYAPPVLVLRVRVMQLPAERRRPADLNRMLLEFNARDLVHGSYGIEGDHVVLTDALELDRSRLQRVRGERRFAVARARVAFERARAVPGEVIMGIFDRFATMVRSNLNDLISRAENPEKMLNQLIVDMRSQLDKATPAGGAVHRRREEARGRSLRDEEAGGGLGAARDAGRAGRDATISPSRR